jgi:hypothetical protein
MIQSREFVLVSEGIRVPVEKRPCNPIKEHSECFFTFSNPFDKKEGIIWT